MKHSDYANLSKLTQNIESYLLKNWKVFSLAVAFLIALLLAFTDIGHWLISRGDYSNALFTLLVLDTVILLGVLTKLILNYLSDDTPKWMRYTTDEYHGARWTWKYLQAFDQITDLQPHCINCKHDLKVVDGEYPEKMITCPSCNSMVSRFFGSYENYLQTIRDLIKQKIRKTYLE
jgi:ribosomal protein L34E